MAILIYCDSDGVERQFELGSEPVMIGRAEECTIRSEDPLVSRRHASLQLAADGNVWIEDLGSANGVFVGVERVTRAALDQGEIALVGSIVLQLVGNTDYLPGIHTRLWSWLRGERLARAAVQEERNALGHRVGELHLALEDMAQGGSGEAAQRLAGEFATLRAQASQIGELLAEADNEKTELVRDMDEARRSWSKSNQKQLAELLSTQSKAESLAETMAGQTIELEDLRATILIRDDEIRGLREDLDQLAQASSSGAQREATEVAALRGEKSQLADQVAALNHELEELKRSSPADAAAQIVAATAASRELEGQIAKLTEEIDELRWTEHVGHSEASRLKVQLESALAEVGKLRSAGSDVREINAGTLSQAELDKAELIFQVTQLESEIANLKSSVSANEARLKQVEEQLDLTRADAEAAWAEVDGLRDGDN